MDDLQTQLISRAVMRRWGEFEPIEKSISPLDDFEKKSIEFRPEVSAAK
jgi:hypothetical protein